MRRYSLSLLAAAALGVAVSQSATAADLGRPVYKAPPPPPPPVSDWSGIFVGLEGGYGWGDQDQSSTFPGAADPSSCAADVLFVGSGIAPFNCTPLLAAFGDPEFQFLNAFFGQRNPTVTLGNIKTDGGLFGGVFGAQKQWGSWVLGIEGDVDWADMKGSVEGSNSTSAGFTVCAIPGVSGPCDPITRSQSVHMDAKIDMLASLRGKVGWSFAPDWLIYGTGGAAFGHVQETINQSATVNFCDELVIVGVGCANIPIAHTLSGGSSLNGTGGDTMFGWAAGAGVDWKWQLDSGSALVFGVEYLHYDFPNQTVTVADSGNGGNTFSVNFKEHVDSIKGRVTYLFDIH